ncbi:MAG TPA: hypothetical protein VJ850_00360 [Candidatus Limnocylindrales bacterium]|nr:hypothetical protein [Candidatus Limnocylindrales bacterium]
MIRRRLASIVAAAALVLVLAAQAYADTQGNQTAASTDKNLWLGVVVLVLLVGSLIVIRPRPRR